MSPTSDVALAPKWRDIPSQDRDRLRALGYVNGCGPKMGFVNWLVPDVLFGLHITEDCEHHDWNYSLGGDEAERAKADRQLYERIKDRARAKTESWWWRWMRPVYYFAAKTYHMAVSYWGKDPELWNYHGPLTLAQYLELLQ